MKRPREDDSEDEYKFLYRTDYVLQKFVHYEVVYRFCGPVFSSDFDESVDLTDDEFDVRQQLHNPFLFRKDFRGEALGLTSRHGHFLGYVHEFIDSSADDNVFVIKGRHGKVLLFGWHKAGRDLLGDLSEVLFNDDRSVSVSRSSLKTTTSYEFYRRYGRSSPSALGGGRNGRYKDDEAFSYLILPPIYDRVAEYQESCCDAHHFVKYAMRHQDIEATYTNSPLRWFRVASGYCTEDVKDLPGGDALCAIFTTEYRQFHTLLDMVGGCSELSIPPHVLLPIRLRVIAASAKADGRLSIPSHARRTSREIAAAKVRLHAEALRAAARRIFFGRVLHALQVYDWAGALYRLKPAGFWPFLGQVLLAVPYESIPAFLSIIGNSDNWGDRSMNRLLSTGLKRIQSRYDKARERVIKTVLTCCPADIVGKVMGFSEGINWHAWTGFRVS